MVIDTSAIVALLLNEPEADDIEIALDDDPVRLFSAASFLETAIYALAATTGEPLLFKGDDFALADVAWVRPDEREVAPGDRT